MKKKLTWLITGVMCISLLAGCGGSNSGGTGGGGEAEAPKQYKIQAAHGAAETTAMHDGWVEFKRLVEERSEGNITVEIYPNQQMGGDREIIEATQIGNLTMCSPSTAPLAAFNNAFFVLDLPFLFANRDQVYEVLDGPAGVELLGTLEEFKLKGLGYWENGFRNFTNDTRPVKSPADLTGLKVRTMENEIHLAAWRGMGANPTPMAFGELYTALQQGTVDGQENPFELIYSTKFHEVQKYITKTQHIYSAYIPLMNLEFYNSLPAEYQTLIDQAIVDATAVQRANAAKKDADIEVMLSETNEITILSDAELQAFRDAMAPVADMVKEKAGAEITTMFLDATK